MEKRHQLKQTFENMPLSKRFTFLLLVRVLVKKFQMNILKTIGYGTPERYDSFLSTHKENNSDICHIFSVHTAN